VNNTASGVINVWADKSSAFGGTMKQLINNGTVNLYGYYSSFYADDYKGPSAEHTADITAPAPTTPGGQGSVPGFGITAPAPTVPGGQGDVPVSLAGYVVGTNANGTAGTLNVSRASLNGVQIDTGFTAGTAARQVTFTDVVKGANLQNVDAIESTSIVWKAESHLNEKGHVDVTMTKNNYADVSTDKQVTGIAEALDKSYTNNTLFRSLNLKTVDELNRALGQISGNQATTAFNGARILGSRFERLTTEASPLGNGMAFNVITRNDIRAELGNKARFDMFALKQAFSVTKNQNVEIGYGIARLNGNGSEQAGDNGLTGGWSQFMSLKHQLTFGDDYSLTNHLRYDRHDLKSSRLIQYGDITRTALSDTRQHYLEFKTEGRKEVQLSENVTLSPSVGVKFRHTVNESMREHGAGDFNLKLGQSTKTATDAVAGISMSYSGNNGLKLSAKLEGGPNISFLKSDRKGTLQGAEGAAFSTDDGQRGGGINGLADAGVNYTTANSNLSFNTYYWQEDGLRDKGLMLNYNYRF
ncbi:TPA: autotransporter domain-containing protein, partial [Escherichia coli]|nr:autotransporter domain-containing protein [Escherichia coli]